MQKTDQLTTATLAVPCIEVMSAAPSGSRRFAGPYYPDEIEMLRKMLRGLSKREDYVVAPEGNGFSIFKIKR